MTQKEAKKALHGRLGAAAVYEMLLLVGNELTQGFSGKCSLGLAG